MRQDRTIIAAAVAATLLAVPLAASAADVVVRVGPPAPRVEAVPAPRAGFVWAPGHWLWSGGRYVWGPGRWVAERRGYRWAPGAWVREGPAWRYAPGHWVR